MSTGSDARVAPEKGGQRTDGILNDEEEMRPTAGQAGHGRAGQGQ